jgi:hypothetical protein
MEGSNWSDPLGEGDLHFETYEISGPSQGFVTEIGRNEFAGSGQNVP